MFLSTVIATIGRPTLRRSVESLLSQQVAPDDYEVIVVNDSGTGFRKRIGNAQNEWGPAHKSTRAVCGSKYRRGNCPRNVLALSG